MNKFDVAIVGGGASGLLCAIECARSGKRVVVLEASERVGKKLLASGNGRCNLSNKNIKINNYNSAFGQNIIEKYSSEYVVNCFEKLGLLCKFEEERIYPLSESGNTVLSVLLLQLQRWGVEIVCNVKIEKIIKTNDTTKNDNCFLVKSGGQVWSADNVVLACGSKASFGLESYNLAIELGHNKSVLKPSLVSLPTTAFCGANGVRAKAAASLVVDGKVVIVKNGEFLFKDNALSGILAFELSSALARQLFYESAVIKIDFAPNLSEEELIWFLKENCNAIDPLVGIFNKALARIILSRVAMDRSLLMTDGKCKNIAKVCKNFEVEISANTSFANAQVCCGGLITKDFDAKTLQSKLCEKLFACGEMLDVDGDCGGFNLHWAWASGLAVANEIVVACDKKLRFLND